MTSRRSSRRRRASLRVRSIDGYDDVDFDDDDVDAEEEQQQQEVDDDDDDDDDQNEREMGMQIVCFSQSQQPFTLPDDWLVEQRPRASNPSHVDKYYYEPGSGRQFRSLLAVQRYLGQGTTDCRTTERMVSENENETYKEPGTGQKFRSLRAVDRYNAYTTTPKVPTPSKQITSVVKSGSTGNQSSPGSKSSRKAVNKRSYVAEEDKISSKALKPSVQSTDPKKSDSPKKINLVKDNRASMHNLSSPPEKVTWVLSGPGGFWSPYLDDSIVPESEKLKWSEAFVLSIHDGVVNGHNS